MATSKRLTPRRAGGGPPTLKEHNLFVAGSAEAQADHYGSLKAAVERFTALAWDVTLAESWWALYGPEELREGAAAYALSAEGDWLGPVEAHAQVQARRRQWLIDNGHKSPAEQSREKTTPSDLVRNPHIPGDVFRDGKRAAGEIFEDFGDTRGEEQK